MYYLVYVSSAVKPFTPRGLKKLLIHCRDNNIENGVTGILLYLEGKFVQILEGKREVVKDLYEKIKRDRRHKEVSRILEGPMVSRNFPNFSMGFFTVDNKTFVKLSGFKDINEFFSYPHVEYHDHPAMIFLRNFKDRELSDDEHSTDLLSEEESESNGND
ncbi:MAG: hypothetical protein DHS20C17_15910 [Cyclobacteriaceae bacterium]|nr:MAG: hypothetical protein DHS20C17_15910 [Cyclobacteriaceae bacterium]